jgi:hypothetical protein
MLPGEELLLGVQSASSGSVRAFHVINAATGAVVRSFGEVAIVNGRPDDAASLFVAQLDGSVLWQWHVSDYRLDGWRTDGSKGETLDLSETPWFKPTIRSASKPMSREEQLALDAIMTSRKRDSLLAAVATNQPAGTTLQVIGVDVAGRIWIRTAPSMPRAPTANVAMFLDIVDPATRSKHVSTRITEPLRLISGTDLVYSQQRDADGITTLAVSRIEIRRP